MLKITKYNIPSVMLDNDIQMFNLLFKVIEKVDSEAQVLINRTSSSYKIMITPSDKKLKDIIVDELKELSVILGDVFEFADFTQHILYNIHLSTK